MKLNPAAFNAHLANMGQDFTWARAFACPCVDPNSGAAAAYCQICFGRGRYWSTPVPATAGVANQKTQQAWAQFGMYEAGDTVLSVPSNSPLYNAGQFDRVLALNTTEEFSIVILPAANNRLLLSLIAISRVFYLNAELTETIEAAIPAVDGNGNMTWPNGGGPPAGVTYTVTGTRYQEFAVWGDFPANRMEHHGFLLPKRIVARRFDLMGR